MFSHRNSQKRIYGRNKIYFITTNTYHGFEYFYEPLFCDLLVENLRFCKKFKQFELYAFCVLYDHVHLLLKPGNKYNISKIMHNIKRVTTLHINQIITATEGENIYFRLRCECKKRFVKKYGRDQKQIPPFQWQHSFHDHIIRNQADFENHYHYTVQNHLKYGLPPDWPYTSLNYSDLVDDTFGCI